MRHICVTWLCIVRVQYIFTPHLYLNYEVLLILFIYVLISLFIHVMFEYAQSRVCGYLCVCVLMYALFYFGLVGTCEWKCTILNAYQGISELFPAGLVLTSTSKCRESRRYTYIIIHPIPSGTCMLISRSGLSICHGCWIYLASNRMLGLT